MSAFAALTGFEGDDEDIVQENKKKVVQEQQARDREAERARINFDALKSKAGTTNWADDSDEDDFFNSGPPLQNGSNESVQAVDEGRVEHEQDKEDEDEDDVQGAPLVQQPPIDGATSESPSKGSRRNKPSKQQQELEEVDSLLAELDVKDAEKENPEGMSKAAAKRAKKKAKEADDSDAEEKPKRKEKKKKKKEPSDDDSD